MSKRIIVSIACLGIIWGVGANAERLFAEDEPLENALSGKVAETQLTEEEEEVEADPFERGRGGEMGRGGMSMGSMGGGRGGRLGGRSGPGTFTVATSDKRSILVNTTTGESWQLMIDNPGSHWEPIAMGVSKGGKTEISWPAPNSGESPEQLRKLEQLRMQQVHESDRQVNKLTNDRSKLEGQLRHLSDELSKSKRRELKLEAALRSFEKSQVQNEEEEAEEKKNVEEGAATSGENNPFE